MKEAYRRKQTTRADPATYSMRRSITREVTTTTHEPNKQWNHTAQEPNKQWNHTAHEPNKQWNHSGIYESHKLLEPLLPLWSAPVDGVFWMYFTLYLAV